MVLSLLGDPLRAGSLVASPSPVGVSGNGGVGGSLARLASGAPGFGDAAETAEAEGASPVGDRGVLMRRYNQSWSRATTQV